MPTVESYFLLLLWYCKMKYKHLLLFFIGLLVIGMLVNSCKKDDQGTIKQLFSGNTWQLASLIRYSYTGSSLDIADTLNVNCETTQFFTFNSDNTCTYTNFDCKSQPVAKGNWSLSSDKLFLMSDITCQDTIPSSTGTPHTTKPFTIARIMNLGQYSLVLQTGNLDVYYPPDEKRMYYVYGFVRVKPPQ